MQLCRRMISIISVCVHMGMFLVNRLEDQRCTSAKLFLQFHSTIVEDCCYILRGGAKLWNDSSFMLCGNAFWKLCQPRKLRGYTRWGAPDLKQSIVICSIYARHLWRCSLNVNDIKCLQSCSWHESPPFLDVSEVLKQIGNPRLSLCHPNNLSCRYNIIYHIGVSWTPTGFHSKWP